MTPKSHIPPSLLTKLLQTLTLWHKQNAFRILGETHIPALLVDVSDEDAFIISLAENIARRGHRPLEILADIEILRKRGYDADTIIHKTGLSPKYVKDIVFLLDQGGGTPDRRRAARRHPDHHRA